MWPTSQLRRLILEELHSSQFGGHSGFFRPLAKVKQQFYWKGLNREVCEFVAKCQVCQQIKIPPAKPIGLLQLPLIPLAVWEEVSMDFVTSLLLVRGHSVIVVIVDHLTKYCHLG